VVLVSCFESLVNQVAQSAEGQLQFDAILTGLLRRILDSNKRVQEAACSAFATLEEVFASLCPNFIIWLLIVSKWAKGLCGLFGNMTTQAHFINLLLSPTSASLLFNSSMIDAQIAGGC